jgi:hypothetical protein
VSNCGVFDLMVDVVEHWMRERNVRASVSDWDDLVERLSKVDEQLQSKYKCQRRSVIVSGYEPES